MDKWIKTLTNFAKLANSSVANCGAILIGNDDLIKTKEALPGCNRNHKEMEDGYRQNLNLQPTHAMNDETMELTWMDPFQ